MTDLFTPATPTPPAGRVDRRSPWEIVRAANADALFLVRVIEVDTGWQYWMRTEDTPQNRHRLLSFHVGALVTECGGDYTVFTPAPAEGYTSAQIDALLRAYDAAWHARREARTRYTAHYAVTGLFAADAPAIGAHHAAAQA